MLDEISRFALGQDTASLSARESREHGPERLGVVAGPRHRHERAELQDPGRIAPGEDVQHGVGAGDEEEPRVGGEFGHQSRQGVHGVVDPGRFEFAARDPELRVARRGDQDHLEARLARGHLALLVGRRACGHEEHPVECELLAGPLGRGQMARGGWDRSCRP